MSQPIEAIAPLPSIAVVGCGSWGRNWVRVLDGLGALSLVCDTGAVALYSAARLAPAARRVDELDAVLRSDVEGVVIATPAESHSTLARRVLLAGKDVLVEKPLALDYCSAHGLVRLAEERGRMLMVGHLLDYHPAVDRILALASSGALGSLRHICSSRLGWGRVRAPENALLSLAPHDLSTILRLVGERPCEVGATGGSFLQAGIADVVRAHLVFECGVRADLHVSWLHPFKEQRLVVIGSKKSVCFDDVAKRLVLYDHGSAGWRDGASDARGGETLVFAATEPLELAARAFLLAVQDRRLDRASGQSALAGLEVIDAAQDSMNAGGVPVRLHTDERKAISGQGSR